MANKPATEKPLLIFWIAWTNDYQKENPKAPNPQGPNYNFHQHFYGKGKYEKHLLLTSCSKNENTKAERSILFANYLSDHFKKDGHQIELCFMGIQDVIGFKEILDKVQLFLADYRDRELHVLISPGTPMMQVVWVTIAQSGFVPNIRLFQGIEHKLTASGMPEIREVIFEASSTAYALVAQAKPSKAALAKSDHKLVSSLEPVYRKADKIAAFPLREITTLIYGETGTGKENLANYLHQSSGRKSQVYKAFNCAALSDQTLESRLFGYVKGAFTGADKDTPGIFQECNGGTLFLDEIGDISPRMQQMLLRTLQEGTVYKMGSVQEEKVDVKVIAATHHDLKQLCNEKKFRWDLYFRLTTTELQLPPLRDYSKADKKQLLEHLIKLQAKKLEQAQPIKATPAMLKWMASYLFPGNIRELIQIINRWYIFGLDELETEVSASTSTGLMSPDAFQSSTSTTSMIENWNMDLVMGQHARKALSYFKNQKLTAQRLGMSVNTLKKYLGEVKNSGRNQG